MYTIQFTNKILARDIKPHKYATNIYNNWFLCRHTQFAFVTLQWKLFCNRLTATISKRSYGSQCCWRQSIKIFKFRKAIKFLYQASRFHCFSVLTHILTYSYTRREEKWKTSVHVWVSVHCMNFVFPKKTTYRNCLQKMDIFGQWTVHNIKYKHRK